MSKRCELCGDDRSVLTRLGWFIEAGVRTLDRCKDERACRERVEASGEDWPLETSAEAQRRRFLAAL